MGNFSRSQHAEELALWEQIFEGTKAGTFVEMGALDGLTFSNTAAYEQVLGWRGILIEANPRMCPLLWANRPMALALCTAVSSDYSSIRMEKGSYTATFGEVAEMDPQFRRKTHKSPGRYNQQHVPSAPLGQLLRMVGVRFIDLFSLDVEGSEYKVLQTFDWTIPVRAWCIEVMSRRHSAEIGALMRSHGYVRREWAVKASPSLSDNELWVWGNVTELKEGFNRRHHRWSQFERSRMNWSAPVA